MVDSLFIRSDYFRDPYAVLAQIRLETSVYQTSLPDGAPVYLVMRYDDVQVGLKDGRLIKSVYTARSEETPPNPLYTSTMLKTDPPQHTRLRALAHEAFTPKFVSQLRGHVQEIADQLLDTVQDQGGMDLVSAYAFPLPITVICEMLGVPTADEDRFRVWSTALMTAGVLSSESGVPSPALMELTQYLAGLVQQRAQNPQDDLISRLIHVEQKGDRLNPVELIATLIVLLVAGHETTVNLIGNGALALLQNPDQLEALRRDPTLIKAAVEELLRFANPVVFVNRYAAETLTIAGTTIPKGSHVLLSLASADHDPDYRENPDVLDLANGDSQHVAFGLGIHYCLGAPLARLEGDIALTTLLRRFPNLRLTSDPIQWRPTLETRSLQALPVLF